MLRLTVTGPDKAPKVFESDDEIITIGTAPDCTIAIAEKDAAAKHCHIERTAEGQYKLVDLETHAGTQVNGVRVNVQLLEDGDKLAIGGTSILVESGDPGEMRTDRVPLLRSRRRRHPVRRRRFLLPKRASQEKVFTFEDLRLVLDSIVEEQGAAALDEIRKLIDALYEEQKGAPLFESLEQERDNLLRMLQINKLLTGERNLKKLLEVVMDAVIEFTGAERGFLILREGPATVIKVARNFDREAIKKPEFKVSHTIAEEVIRTGKPIISSDALNDTKLPAAGSVADLKLRSLLCMPFKLRDEVLGCVYIDNRFETGVFVDSDLPLLQGFAEQAALAIENTRLFEENQRRQEELQRSREEVERLNEQLRDRVEKQYAELSKVKQDLMSQQKTVELKHDFSAIIGKSRSMLEVFLLLDKVLDTDEPVFIHGESGTGKELIARAVHFNSKRAKTGRLMSENVSAIPDTLLESELFGHEKGAFTGAIATKQGLFELAHRGTLFLDEIGDMSIEMQKKLLRALQEGELRRVGGKDVIKVDCRIISASNKDLRQLIKEQKFREDLFYRLNVVQITLPPLRERREDIPLLVEHFLERAAKENNQPKRKVEEVAYWYLQNYPWPGNVRELENEMRRSVALSDELITIDVLKEEIRSKDLFKANIKIPTGSALKDIVKEAIEDVERKVILKALEETGWKKTEAARALGISRPTLDAKIEAYGLEKGQAVK